MSAKDSIIVLPEPDLRRKSQRVAFITPQVREIVNQMIEATIDWEASREHEVGVALAAIQIDKPYKIIVIRQDFDDKSNKNFSIFINPEITKLEGEVKSDFEGCLSVKDIYGKVPRYSRVRMRAMNENGQTVRVKAEGFLARVLQHEVDHTKGIMFIDHIRDNPEAFYKLTKGGKLESLTYEQAADTGIFR